MGQLLLVDNAGLAEPGVALFQRVPDAPEIVAHADGRDAVEAFARMARAGAPPVLVVVDEDVPRIEGRNVLRAIRAIERAFGLSATAALVYSSQPADAGMKGFLSEIGRAVHLVRPVDQPPAEQARRFVLASRKLISVTIDEDEPGETSNLVERLMGKKPENALKKRTQDLAKLLGIQNRLSHKPAALSGGEQQRVAVARALVNNPDMIFADEPSGNLDTQNAQSLHELFFKLRDEFGQSFVIVTHNQSLAGMSDRMLTMEDGKILA